MVKKKVQTAWNKVEDKRAMIDRDNEQISVVKQCELLGLAHSTCYYKEVKNPVKESFFEKVKRYLLNFYMKWPYFGKRRMCNELKKRGIAVSREKVKSLMNELKIYPVYPKPNLSKPNKQHKKYPYLLNNVEITHTNQVWSTDITYIRMPHGFVYLTAVIDWHSRFVLSWKVSTTLEGRFCREALLEAIAKYGVPEIFNSDQGVQFTDKRFTDILESREIQISMDGKGRALDNIYIERLWRTVKYEEIFLKSYNSVKDLRKELEKYFRFYNYERDHSSHDYKTPWEIYSRNMKVKEELETA
ncbi:MAG TPA: IS3 family transposase [bacterium]|jgi:putative transposase|nr:IS3 family transposase [bacterium]